MSEKSELAQRAEQVLLDLVNKAAEIGSAAVDEIPLVVQELLAWKLAESLLLFLLSICIFVAVFLLGKKSWKSIDDIGELIMPIFFFLLLFAGAGIIAFNLDWLQILLAPRVYLLEYTSSLVR